MDVPPLSIGVLGLHSVGKLHDKLVPADGQNSVWNPEHCRHFTVRRDVQVANTETVVKVPDLETPVSGSGQQELMLGIEAGRGDFQSKPLAVQHPPMGHFNQVETGPGPGIPDDNEAVKSARDDDFKELVVEDN